VSVPDLEVVRMHVATAYTRASDPDALQHLHAALRELNPEDLPPGLVECPDCGRIGHPE
jgi:hypothetical protein